MFDITEPIVQLLGVGLTVDGSASLTGESDLTSAAIIANVASSNLSAGSDLTATLTYVAVASSDLSGSSDLSSDVILVAQAAVSLSAESDLTAGIQQAWQAEAILSASASLTVASNIVALGIAMSAGSSQLTATVTRVIIGLPRIMRSRTTGTFTILVGHPVQARPLNGSARLTGTIYTQPRVLVLPTVRYTYTENVLLRRYAIENGRSLLITGSQGVIGDFFAQDQIEDADFYFGGGRRHELEPDEEAAVVAAGYGDLIVTEFLS